MRSFSLSFNFLTNSLFFFFSFFFLTPPARYVELGPGKSDEGSNRLREGLRELTGQDSLPQVFVNGMHLGEGGISAPVLYRT